MKAFLLRVGIFAVAVLCLFGMGEWYVESRPNAARDKHKWMTQHSRDVQTLILGSSHTFYGVCPQVLGDKTFSLAQVSQTYRYDAWLLGNYPTDSLRTIVLPFSYFSLYEDYESGVGEDYIARYRIYMDCPLHSRWSEYGLECLNLTAFKEKLKGLFRPSRNSWDEHGWGTNYTVANKKADWNNGEERALAHTYTDTTAVAFNTEQLHKICRYCKERGIKVLLLTTPVTATYRQHKDSLQTARNKSILKALLQAHPEVTYLNLEADERFESEDFFDADHLTDTGAAKLSKIIRTFIAP